MSDHYDAREFQTSNFLKKEDLRRDGPQTLMVRAVEQGEGFGRNGKPAPPVLQLQFTDERRLSLGTQANLKRMIEWFGPLTSGWIGQTIVAYYSPDVRGPGGEEGGIRLRRPEGAPAPAAAAQHYADVLANDVPFEQSELPPAAPRGRKAARS